MASNRYFKCRKDIFAGVKKEMKYGITAPHFKAVFVLRTHPLYKSCNMLIAAFVYVHSNLRLSSQCSTHSSCQKLNKSNLGPSERNLQIHNKRQTINYRRNSEKSSAGTSTLKWTLFVDSVLKLPKNTGLTPTSSR